MFSLPVLHQHCKPTSPSLLSRSQHLLRRMPSISKTSHLPLSSHLLHSSSHVPLPSIAEAPNLETGATVALVGRAAVAFSRTPHPGPGRAISDRSPAANWLRQNGNAAANEGARAGDTILRGEASLLKGCLFRRGISFFAVVRRFNRVSCSGCRRHSLG